MASCRLSPDFENTIERSALTACTGLRRRLSHTTFGSSNISRSGTGVLIMLEMVADVNGDGIPDVLAFGGDGLTVLLGQSGLTFAPSTEYALAYSGYSLSSRASLQRQYVDLNGDGRLDILTAGPNGMYLLFGRADGTFASALTTRVSEVSGTVAIAAFDGDGKPDLVSTGAPPTTLSLGRGDGTFAAPTPVLSTPFGSSQPILAADFSGDGKADLRSADSSSNHFLMLGQVNGTYASDLHKRAAALLHTDPHYRRQYLWSCADCRPGWRW